MKGGGRGQSASRAHQAVGYKLFVVLRGRGITRTVARDADEARVGVTETHALHGRTLRRCSTLNEGIPAEESSWGSALSSLVVAATNKSLRTQMGASRHPQRSELCGARDLSSRDPAGPRPRRSPRTPLRPTSAEQHRRGSGAAATLRLRRHRRRRRRGTGRPDGGRRNDDDGHPTCRPHRSGAHGPVDSAGTVWPGACELRQQSVTASTAVPRRYRRSAAAACRGASEATPAALRRRRRPAAIEISRAPPLAITCGGQPEQAERWRQQRCVRGAREGLCAGASSALAPTLQLRTLRPKDPGDLIAHLADTRLASKIMSETTIAPETAAPAPPAVASTPPAPPTAIDTPPATQLLIEHSLGAPTGVPRVATRSYTRVHTATLRQSKKIAPLLPPPTDEPLRVALDDASLRPEALVHALECVGAPPPARTPPRRSPTSSSCCARRRGSRCRRSRRRARRGCAARCASRTRSRSPPPPTAARRTRLLAEGFRAEGALFIQRRRRRRCGSPQLGPRGISQGRLALPHGVWRPVRAAGEASHASVLTPRPRYTMCLLERVRRDDAPTRSASHRARRRRVAGGGGEGRRRRLRHPRTGRGWWRRGGVGGAIGGLAAAARVGDVDVDGCPPRDLRRRRAAGRAVGLPVAAATRARDRGVCAEPAAGSAARTDALGARGGRRRRRRRRGRRRRQRRRRLAVEVAAAKAAATTSGSSCGTSRRNGTRRWGRSRCRSTAREAREQEELPRRRPRQPRRHPAAARQAQEGGRRHHLRVGLCRPISALVAFGGLERLRGRGLAWSCFRYSYIETHKRETRSSAKRVCTPARSASRARREGRERREGARAGRA